MTLFEVDPSARPSLLRRTANGVSKTQSCAFGSAHSQFVWPDDVARFLSPRCGTEDQQRSTRGKCPTTQMACVCEDTQAYEYAASLGLTIVGAPSSGNLWRSNQRQRPEETTGACCAVFHGSLGHHRAGGAGCSGSTLSPGLGVTTVTFAARPAAITRSIGSTHECRAKSKVPQCTGSITRPRTA